MGFQLISTIKKECLLNLQEVKIKWNMICIKKLLQIIEKLPMQALNGKIDIIIAKEEKLQGLSENMKVAKRGGKVAK